MQASTPCSTEGERAELDTVVSALARTPRLASLLSYLGERYFQSRTDEINEYNLATEVFGRSKTNFDASRDSIARVEAFRLRRRLKEYYETDGKDHEIQISLPSGSYIPTFTCRVSLDQMSSMHQSQADRDAVEELSRALAVDTDEALVSSKPGKVATGPGSPRVLSKRNLVVAAAGVAALLVVSFGATWFFFSRSMRSHQSDPVTEHPSSATQHTPQNAAQVPLRLLAGYEGSPRIDSAGEYWQPDRYYLGGAAFQRPDAQVRRTSDPMLFDHWRTSDFTYNIPLAPGPYELHLFFVASPQDDPKTSYFNVSVNGEMLLSAFNISSDALGANIADERVFKDIYPDKDGILHLKFFMERSGPVLNALEILPGLPHRQLPVRLVMQRAAFKDHDGNIWHPDNYFDNGTLSDSPRLVDGTPDPGLYAQERYGHFTYSIPVDTRGHYTLVLHFAELYWAPDPSGSGSVGMRVFRIYCNGSTLLDNFDIFKEAGSLHAITKRFNHLRPTPEGKLDLTFEPIENYATVSAIEVIDESK